MIIGKSLLALFTDASTVRILTILAIIVAGLSIISYILNISILAVSGKLMNQMIQWIGKKLGKRENIHKRNMQIDKDYEKRTSSKVYRFLSDLILDLNLRSSGVNPTSLSFMLNVISIVVSIVTSVIIFRTIFLFFLPYPIVLAGLVSLLYTRANLAHNIRYEAIITAENILCNNIRLGVFVAIRENIDTIPEVIREPFRKALYASDENTHKRNVLIELNNDLGSTADDFIAKCIAFELDEEKGLSGMFADIVYRNSVKITERIDLKKKTEEKVNIIKIGILMIFVFMVGTVIVYPTAYEFLFNTIVGNIVLFADFVIFILMYVWVTYIRAQEL